MSRNIKRFLGLAAGGLLFLLVAAILAYQLLAKELDQKFFEAMDAVPTRVYSGLFWVAPGNSFSLEEWRSRLKERDYRELSPTAENLGTASFSISPSNSEGARQLRIHLSAFEYPPPVKEVFFPQGSKKFGTGTFIVDWAAGTVRSIKNEAGEDVQFALEPVLVAQLNNGAIEARKTLSIANIPHTLLKAIVIVEDQRFLDHIGFDPKGIMRSMWANIRAGAYVQGASTITQQLAKNIYLNRKKTISRKLTEIVMAMMMEMRFSKDQILEKYLNEVYFGQAGNIAIHGVSEAAKFYFDKTLDDLSLAEQAMLAGLVRGPFYYSPFRHLERAKQRQELVLRKMLEANIITEGQFKRAMGERLKFAKSSPVQDRAPYFTDMIKAQLFKDLPEQEIIGSGYKIFSTLDTYYQKQAELAVERGIANLEGTLKQRLAKKKGAPEDPKTLQGVFIAIDPKSGHLLALVGGRSYEESNYNRALLMRRHVGSTMKPFVYLAALVSGENEDGSPMNAITKMEDKPFTYKYDEQVWTPKNYEDEFAGTVTLRFALANSINTVAAQLAVQVGLEKVVELANLAGIDSKLDPLPSLSLGAVELAPMEIAAAYTTLANFGLRREITSTLLVVDEEGKLMARFVERDEQTLPAAETANLVDMMSSIFSIGTAKYAKDAGFTWPAAGKTGTTNEFRDAWFAGFSQKLLALSWVGFDRDDEVVKKQRKVLKLTGAVGALPIWVDFMKAAHKEQAPQNLEFPDSLLKRIEVDLLSGGKATADCSGPNVVEEVFTMRNAPHYDCR